MYSINYILIEQLPSTLHMFLKSFLSEIGISRDIWLSRLDHPEGWRVGEIIRICNSFRVPVELMLLPEGDEGKALTKDELSGHAASYQAVRFDARSFGKAWRVNSRCRMQKEAKAEKMGVTQPTVNKWIRKGEESPLTLVQLAKFCQLFGYELSEFVKSEPSTPLPCKPPSSTKALKEENQKLREEIATLKKQLAAARELNEKLAKNSKRVYAMPDNLPMIAAEDNCAVPEREKDLIS